jgi:hypothetical protein
MEKILLISLLVLLLSGCGKTIKETATNETIVSNEITYREPYPILREYEKRDGYIEFTESTGQIEISTIDYSNPDVNGVGADKHVLINCPIGNNGKVVTLQVRGKSHEWTAYDNNFHNVCFFMKTDTEYPDVKYLGMTDDVLNINNQYDFVRLFVDNVLVETYYLSDF